jgi:hypothetical protein
MEVFFSLLFFFFFFLCMKCMDYWLLAAHNTVPAVVNPCMHVRAYIYLSIYAKIPG